MSASIRAIMLSLFCVLGSIANADPVTLNFSFTGSSVTATGAMTGSQSGTGYLVSSIIGQYNGSPITGVLTAGTFQGNDNLSFAAQPYLDFSGIAFSVGSSNYNVFYDDGTNNCESTPGYYLYFGQDAASPTCGSTVDQPVTFNITQAPEPSGVWLMGVGVLAVIRRYRAYR